MRKRWIGLIVLVAVALAVVLLCVRGCRRAPAPGLKPPSPASPYAPKWDPANPPPLPPYEWPDAFRLPPHPVIEIKDLPEAPEEVRGPSPPIEEEGDEPKSDP